jgi:hypothetical protein
MRAAVPYANRRFDNSGPTSQRRRRLGRTPRAAAKREHGEDRRGGGQAQGGQRAHRQAALLPRAGSGIGGDRGSRRKRVARLWRPLVP